MTVSRTAQAVPVGDYVNLYGKTSENLANNNFKTNLVWRI